MPDLPAPRLPVPPAPPPASSRPWPQRIPVLIAGGGPVGLTLAALLARQGIAALVVEADDGYCAGSRAICMARRSLEILGWAGADRATVATGLPWVGGRSYYRDTEVLHFQMPSEPGERFAPMVNIQQYYLEAFAHDAALRGASPAEVRFGARLRTLRQHAGGVVAGIETGAGAVEVDAQWLVACDGGRSTVREQLGLRMEGTQYEGRYVIVDIVQKTRREVERLAWFDPPSNPGSTLLMHRQPDDVWRIDYQLRDDEDPDEAVRPENVLPRVQSHLDMIGETEPWRPLWISMYNAKCLTLRDYRHGRILFAGDAAHLVPIFGVRGLNSGLDDAGNLAWKLAWVLRGQASDSLLDSYSAERLHATRQNLAYGAKSTEFMAPPDFAFRLMREATLRLAPSEPAVRSLINPRQSAPVAYADSALNGPSDFGADCPGAAPGVPAPEMRVDGPDGIRHLTQCFGQRFTMLWFRHGADRPALPEQLAALAQEHPQALQAYQVVSGTPAGAAALADVDGQAHARYGASPGTLYLIRPDGYVLARWREPSWDAVRATLAPLLQTGARHAS
ncbi:FAD-dependent oxidoreductase [Cupriavidus neocaledonicus]|uniref:3-(3-hydroxy-phenyl)propionate hydroxylase n=1 Tax=Cupriavidus neocaledonicus TaxID=1040979 RepID=A0A375HNR8_9BURK|nr:FAD-dependent oxidoreductase [Cupriavidus neocaledonicus]SOZ37865.1 Putative monooxygenase, FAD-binding domain; FAD dependent oxidoreductase [Cupriavidus neocaledonicus]SPD58626.1 3-(3-hydroxy-phenyl)propionate hydroxylase [Cupriavidus neocaledonicus]